MTLARYLLCYWPKSAMKLNVLPEFIQEDRRKKKEKKRRPEALNPFYMTLISGQITKSQTISKEEALVDSHQILAYQKVFQLSWIFLFSQVQTMSQNEMFLIGLNSKRKVW